MFPKLLMSQFLKFAAIAISIVLASVLIWFRFSNDPNKILASDIRLGVFTNEEKQNGRAFIAVPFSKSENELSFINAALDINGSGDYEEGEWVIKNMPATPEKGKVHHYHFTSGLPLSSGQKKLRVIISDFPFTEDLWKDSVPTGRQFVEAEVDLEIHDIQDFLNSIPENRFARSTTTLEDLNQAIMSTADIPLQINLLDPATQETLGGHTVFLRKIYSAGDKKYIEIADASAGEGSHVYEIRNSGEILNYGLFDGFAVMNIVSE